MTTPSSAFPRGIRDDFDTGPLSWVLGEIREALNRSKTALHQAVAQHQAGQFQEAENRLLSSDRRNFLQNRINQLNSPSCSLSKLPDGPEAPILL